MVKDISASNRWVIPVSVLRRIPGCAGGEAPSSVQLLHGGRNVNRNLRIETGEGRSLGQAETLRPGASHCGIYSALITSSLVNLRPLVQNHVQQGTVDFNLVAVINKNHFSKSIHEKDNARSRRADHLRQCLLADFRYEWLRPEDNRYLALSSISKYNELLFAPVCEEVSLIMAN